MSPLRHTEKSACILNNARKPSTSPLGTMQSRACSNTLPPERFKCCEIAVCHWAGSPLQIAERSASRASRAAALDCLLQRSIAKYPEILSGNNTRVKTTVKTATPGDLPRFEQRFQNGSTKLANTLDTPITTKNQIGATTKNKNSSTPRASKPWALARVGHSARMNATLYFLNADFFIFLRVTLQNLNRRRKHGHSHSIVAGGLLLTS